MAGTLEHIYSDGTMARTGFVYSVMDISFQERYVRRYTKIDDNASTSAGISKNNGFIWPYLNHVLRAGTSLVVGNPATSAPFSTIFLLLLTDILAFLFAQCRLHNKR